MERKSETTRNHTRVNNLTMISLSRSLMKHVIYINSEKLPGKSRPRSIPSLIKRDILRRKRYLIWSVTWFPFGLWPNDQWFQKGCDKVRCYRKQLYFLSLFPHWVNFLELPRSCDYPWSSMKIIRRQPAWPCLWLGIWGRWSVTSSPQLQCRMCHVLHA